MKTLARTSLASLLLLAATGISNAQELQGELSTHLLIEGEAAVLRLYLSGARSSTDPRLPSVPGLQILKGSPRFKWEGRQGTAYFIHVSSRTPGRYRIPPIEIQTTNGSYHSKEYHIHVFSSDLIHWDRAHIQGVEMRYGSVVLMDRESPYVGEAFRSAIKILLPDRNFSMGAWQPPEIDKENLAAWRFEPAHLTNSAGRHEPVPSRVILAEGVFNCYTDESIANGLEEGKARLGPGSMSPIIQLHQQRGGFFLQRGQQVRLTLPSATAQVKPLPPGRPLGFKGAIGQFDLTARMSTSEPPSEGAPVPIELTVTGNGNLDNLIAPILDDDEGIWKTYPAARNEEQSTRREVNGRVVFSQFLRPTRSVDAIPAFKLHYFNPSTERYEVAASRPIPAKLRAAVATPLEDIDESTLPQGLLSLIPVNPDHLISKDKNRPWWWWQLYPAVFAIILLGMAAWRRLLPRLRANPLKAQHKRAIKNLQASPSGTSEFLRECGRYIETWLPPETRDDFLHGLLSERDKLAFCPETAEAPIDKRKKQEILAKLKKYAARVRCILPLTLLLFLLSPPHKAMGNTSDDAYLAAKNAWSKKDWEGIIKAYQNAHSPEDMPADALCNSGAAYFRLNQPGEAALCWWRALARNPKHTEARQNLDFLEHEYGLRSTRNTDSLPSWTSRLPRACLLHTSFASLWLMALASLALLAVRHAVIRKAARLTLVFTPIILLSAGAFCFFYPGQDAPVLPAPKHQAVVVGGVAKLHGEPLHTGHVLLNLKQGTLCQILTTRGRWLYISLIDGTRGWTGASGLKRVLQPQAKAK